MSIKIRSGFFSGIAGRAIEKVCSKKAGVKPSITLNDLSVTADQNDTTHIHLDIDARLSKDELNKLLVRFGL